MKPRLRRYSWAIEYETGLVERGLLLARDLDHADAQVERMLIHAAQRGTPCTASAVAEGSRPIDLPTLPPPEEAP